MSDRYYCKGMWEDRCVYDSELKKHLFIDDCAKLIMEQDAKIAALEAKINRAVRACSNCDYDGETGITYLVIDILEGD